jgi:hypothetical protein
MRRLSHSARNLIPTIATFANDHRSAWSKEESLTNINAAIACAVYCAVCYGITAMAVCRASAAA